MAISGTRNLSEGDFYNKLKKFMVAAEGEFVTPYLDTSTVGGIRHTTIGIGFDLVSTSTRAIVFAEMGIVAGGSIANALIAIINNPPASTSLLVSQLNSAYGQPFVMTSAQIDHVYKSIVETEVNSLKSSTGLPYSDELIAIASAKFNGLFGGGLSSALNQSDPAAARAEAWYQIRYVHADQLHKRRYMETAVFGLYDETITPEGAKAVYQMVTKYRAQILEYEAAHKSLLSAAQTDLSFVGINVKVDSIATLLELGKPQLIEYLKKNYSGVSQAENIDSVSALAIQIGGDGSDVLYGATPLTGYNFTVETNDLLDGEGGGDFLYGREGNDTLIGGSGSDFLDGGAGNDTYIYTYKAGQTDIDTINDVDNGTGNSKGKILFDNSVLTGGKKQDNSNLTWYDDPENPTYTYSATGDPKTSPVTLTITDNNGGQVTVNNFKDGDLGIYLTDADPNKQKKKNNAAVNKNQFNQAERRTSPIILDLDGDGVETTSLANGVYFDHDGNQFKQKTGWVNADDGLLVRDLNDNGRIDDGTELFGNNTFLANGNKAANGFDALAELDSNHDGKIDDQDSGFNSLKIWQDSNQDGVSQYEELKGLSELGIKSLNLNYTSTAYTIPNPGVGQSNVGYQVDANGNEQRELGSYTTTTNQTKGVNDVWFKEDTSLSSTTNTVAITADIAALPELISRGNLDSLHQAMAKDGTGQLKSLVQLFITQTDPIQRDSTLNSILYYWAGVQDVDPTSRAASMIYGNAIGDARKLEFLEELYGQEFLGTWCWGVRDPNPHGPAAQMLLGLYEQAKSYFGAQLTLNTKYADYLSLIDFTVDANGDPLVYNVFALLAKVNSDYAISSTTTITKFSDFIENLKKISDDGIGLITQLGASGNPTGTAAAQIIFSSLSTTRNGSINNETLTGIIGSSNTLYGYGGNDTLNGANLADQLYGGIGNDVIRASTGDDGIFGGTGNDLLSGNDGADTYIFSLGDGQDTISNFDGDSSGAHIDRILFDNTVTPESVIATRLNSELVLTYNNGADSITILGYFTDDGVSPYAVEEIKFSDGANTIWTVDDIYLKVRTITTGNDLIYGNASDDDLNGLAGNDEINGGQGNDTLDGGSGNDSLYGGDGDDVYLFARGGGQDIIQNYELNQGVTNIDILRFDEGIAPEDISMVRAGDDLILSIKNTTDKITIQKYFYQDAIAKEGYAIDRIEFANETSWNIEYIKAQLITPTGSNDSITGYATDDNLMGLGGADTISGGDGNDTISGGAGFDSMQGGNGSDTYILNLGEGQPHDVYTYIYESISDTTLDNHIIFGPGVDLNSIKVSLWPTSSQYLMISYGVNDAVLIKNGFSSIINTYEFSGGAILTHQQLMEMFLPSSNLYDDANSGMIYGGQFNDSIYGNAGNDYLSGQAGKDLLNGGLGDDTLEGGAGRDYLSGDDSTGLAGNDTYKFKSGDGYDLLTDTRGNNRILLGAGVQPSDVTLFRSSDDLYIVVNQSTDQIRWFNYFTSATAASHNDLIEFSDGTIWSKAYIQVAALNGAIETAIGGVGNDIFIVDNSSDLVVEELNQGVDLVKTSVTYVLGNNVENLEAIGYLSIELTGNALANSIIGNSGHNSINGGGGLDTLHGAEGDDLISGYGALYGDDGDDSLYGGSLNDTLYGGNGNDFISGGDGVNLLEGGLGDDTYETNIFNQTNNIVEAENGGIDTIITNSASYTLINNVENLKLIGGVSTVGSTGATGNDLDNIIIGWDNNNTDFSLFRFLNGGLGADTLISRSNGMTFFVDNLGDKVVSNGGTDNVVARVNWTLTSGIDNLELESSTFSVDHTAMSLEINGTGNELNNVIRGNTAKNIIEGLDGNDTLMGGEGQDTIYGGAGDDVLYGGGRYQRFSGTFYDVLNQGISTQMYNYDNSLDYLYGGIGNDTYYLYSQILSDGTTYQNRLDNLSEIIFEEENGGIDTVRTLGSYTLAANLENLILDNGSYVYVPFITLTGNALNNSIIGNQYNETIDGGLGADTMQGGLGDDTYYVDQAGDVVIDTGGNDRVFSKISYTLGAGIESLVLNGTNADSGTGNSADNTLDGSQNNAANVLTGGAGNDIYILGAGDTVVENSGEGTDSVQVSTSYALGSNLENLTLTGNLAIDGVGNDLNNVIDGSLNAAINTLSGAAGDDTYRVGTGDQVVEAVAQGIDTVIAVNTDFILGANIENLTLQGYGFNATGNQLNNLLIGNDGNNTLDGSTGSDTMQGGYGNDTYTVDSTSDIVIELESAGIDEVKSSVTYTLAGGIENLVLTGSDSISGTGNSLDNILDGAQNSSSNVLAGGLGNDTYIVGVGDTVNENASEGIDEIRTNVSYTLGDNLENLTIIGTESVNATGNNLDNRLTGNDGNNILDGGIGADTMSGGIGDDIYIVDSLSDDVQEVSNEGNDTVISSISYSLGSNLENLEFTGIAAINGLGNNLNNRLSGNGGSNVLDGGFGLDTLVGGAGDDSYIVDNENDVVTELSGEGEDTVYSNVSYSLSANVEKIALTGTSSVNATGNNLDNRLTGNDGNNILDGGIGADTMSGGIGDDIYIVDSLSDDVQEVSNEGNDTVISSISYSLGSNLENLEFTGIAAINGLGNNLNNRLSGNGGSNVLDGGLGADTLSGGFGNDTYIVNSADDVVIEEIGFGVDLVNSSVSFSLGDNIENLTLTGSAVSGTGNTQANLIIGNSINNTLIGGSGSDTLVAGIGNDTLIGGSDSDTYAFTAGDGVDKINNFDNSTGHTDKIVFTNVSSSSLRAVRVLGNDLIIDYGTTDSITIQNFLLASQFQVSEVQFTDVTLTTRELLDSLATTLTNGDDSQSLGAGDKFVFADSGNDTLSGQGGADKLFGDDGDDQIDGGSSDDLIDGGADNDILVGGIGADTIVGGVGNDTLEGGDESDTYIFAKGDGQDTIINLDTSSGHIDKIQFLDTSSTSLRGIRYTETDLILDYGASDSVILQNYFVSTDYQVNTVQFTDLSMSIELLLATHAISLGDGDDEAILGDDDDNILGGTGNDSIYGGGGNDSLDGEEGSDYLNGEDGDDFLNGGAGNDILVGVDGNDQINGGSDDDQIYGHNGNDTLYGDQGNDSLYGNDDNDLMNGGSGDDYLQADNGNDTLIGGTGNDTLLGQYGDDTYVFNVGDGTDLVYQYDDAVGRVDKVFFNGIASTELRGLKIDGADFIIEYGLTDSVRFQNLLLSGYGSSFSIDLFQFSDVTFSFADLLSHYSYSLSDNDDAATFSDESEVVYARGGSDAVYLRGGNDKAEGNDGNDSLWGMDGNDTLIGGLGDDSLDGGSGDDVFIVSLGGGNDTITWQEYDVAGTEKLQFSDASSGDISALRKINYDLVIEYGEGDSVTLRYFFLNPERQVSLFEFTDSTLNFKDLLGLAPLYLTDSDESIEGSDQNDAIYAGWGNDTLSGMDGDDQLYGEGSFDSLLGNDGNDLLNGGADNDALDGGSGMDTMIGGSGNDIFYVDNTSDVVSENLGEGTDTIYSSVDYTTSSNVEKLTLIGSANVNGTGNELNNTIIGNSGNNTLNGFTGIDSLVGGQGNDIYIVDGSNDVVTENASEGIDEVQSSATFVLSANIENLTLTGTTAINGTGNDLNNVVSGNSANNTLNGGFGSDTLSGGLGDDTYVVDSAGDVLIENVNEGVDTVQSTVTYVLGTNFENLTLTGTTEVNATGNSVSNVINGNAANNVIDGGAGADTMNGGAGNDTYYVDNSADVISDASGIDSVYSNVTYTVSSAIENLTLTGVGDINGVGNSLNNTITGNSGNNLLNGGSGSDILIGGAGNDTYVVADLGDVVSELANEGIDLIQSSVTFILGANQENLTLQSISDINGTGNTLDNIIVGNVGVNLLDGKVGADTMMGGAGNDTYVVDEVGDQVLENLNEGTADIVQSSINYALTANVERLVLTGTLAINGTGNGLANLITGNSANNILDGVTGNDTLVGGAGDDTYIVDGSDTVTENLSEGTDLVLASATYTLATNVENLTLTGVSAINGTGNSLANILIGNSANNVLNGSSGADTMIGGMGSDTYVVDSLSDVITEDLDSGIDTIQTALTYSLNEISNVENLTLTGTAAVNATGSELNNVITGNVANNILNGGIGADSMVGGAGDDTYIVDNAGDVITEAATSGTDIVQSSVTYTLATNVENLVLLGILDINGTGNTSNNYLTGNAGNNTLDGGSGIDTLIGGIGDDAYIVDNIGDVVTENAAEGNDVVRSSVTYTLGNNLENLTLIGSAIINGTGNTLNNFIQGNSAANTLSGGAGDDTMVGGAGNDTYIVDSVNDVVTESAAEGTDTVQSSVSYILSENVEALTLTGTLAINATGNGANNTLTGNSGNNIIDGGIGADSMVGGAGDDTYIVDNVGDVITEAASAGTDLVSSTVSYVLAVNVENLILNGTSNINGTGNASNNIITGNIGNNTLDGGTGTDTLIGAAGDDTYIVDATTDVVIESAAEGNDTVRSSVTYILASNIENLTLTGTGTINGTGNELNNLIQGNSAANTLSGAAGDDTLVGGAGNDIYIVDSVNDVVTENAAEGTDTIQSSVSYTLAANLESLTLTGASSIDATGNSLANTLTGNSGNNILDGGVGADSMLGGAGDDIYIVDNAGDVITEAVSSGTDTVLSSVSLTLATNVENLKLTGAGNLNAVGNTLANILTGNAGNNTLDGGTGADTLLGGLGDDIYIVDNTGDTITEYGAEGSDLVQASVTYTLAANIENLTLTSTTAINGTGNSLDNILLGNSGVNTLSGGAGNDTLNGGAGADSLVGGTGDDTYIVDNTADVINELVSEGSDFVQSSITYTLVANVENLALTGTSAINGTGNALNNVITGNSGSNVLTANDGNDTLYGDDGNDTLSGGTGADSLFGGAGNDVLYAYTSGGSSSDTWSNAFTGGTGNDSLYGGVGSDTYYFNLGDGQDVIYESAAATDTAIDKIVFGVGINPYDVVITRGMTGTTVNNNLVISLKGTTDTITISNYFAATSYKVERIVFASGVEWDISSHLLLGTTANNTLTASASSSILFGDQGNDTLTGGAGNDYLDGGVGIDSINGGSGNDTLRGGAGDDFLYDNTGNDTFVAGIGSGFDAIEVHHSTPTEVKTLVLEGLNKEDVNLSRWGEALGIGFDKGNGWEGVGLNNFFLSADTRIDVIQFANGETWDYTDIMAQTMNLTGTSSNDVLYGFQNSPNAIYGGEGNDLIIGGQINDGLRGEAGNDIMQAGAGTDFFIDNTGNNVADGGAGTDSFMLGSGNDFIAGGKGYDFINTGTGNDIIAFNKGDGSDVVYSSTEADNTLSLGGNFSYSDLVFTKSGNSLILGLGSGDQISFDDWYTSNANHSVINLQVIAEAMTGFDAAGSNTLLDNKIETFNFTSLVTAFDAARAADATLTSWQLTNALLTNHLSGSDIAAIGGDLAYQYGMNGSLTGIGLTAAQNVINATGFGQSVQGLNASSTWQSETVKLN